MKSERKENKYPIEQYGLGFWFTEKIWEFTYEKAWKKKLSFPSTSNSFSWSAVRKCFLNSVFLKHLWNGKLSSNQEISLVNLPWLAWYFSKSANQFYLLVNCKHHINCWCSLKLLISSENLNQCAFLCYSLSVIVWNVFLDLELWEKNFRVK